jgi:hypothetical protein
MYFLSLTKRTWTPIFIYAMCTIAMILVNNLTMYLTVDYIPEKSTFLKEKQILVSEANVLQKALILTSKFGAFFVFFSTDLTFFVVGVLMLQVVLIYLRHMRESVNELRMRNRLELAAEMWPSQESTHVVDIKYLVCIHQYAIE